MSAGLLLAGSTLAESAGAQVRPLGHEDVIQWRSIRSASLSNDGNWLAYSLAPVEGDPVVVVRQAREGGVSLEMRGERPSFTSDSRWLVISVPPAEAVVDSLRNEGESSADLPPDSLSVIELRELADGSDSALRSLGAVDGYAVAGRGAWVAYVPSGEEAGSDPDAEAEAEPETEAAEDEEGSDEKDKEAGEPLVVIDLADDAELRFEKVADYAFAEEGELLAFATSHVDGDGDGVFVVRLDDFEDGAVPVFEGASRFRRLSVADEGDRIAFLADRDDFDADQPEYVLYLASGSRWNEAEAVASSRSSALPDGWWVSEHGNVSFSDGGERLYFGTSPRPEPEVEDDTPEDERVRLDIWNWKDPYLQPMQLVRAEQERNRSYRAVFHVDDDRLVQVARPDLPDLRIAANENARYAVALSGLPYRQLVSWDGSYADIHVVDLLTGESRLLAERVKGSAGISPEGRFAYWWDGDERDWMIAELGTGTLRWAGRDVPHPLWRELSDAPDLPPAYGAAGWTEGDRSFIFYDRFDAWSWNPNRGSVANLTEGYGRERGIRFRLIRTEPDLPYIRGGGALWSAFDETTKQAGFFEGRSDRGSEPDELVMSDHAYGWRGRAENVERWLFTRSTFREYPDIWVAGGSLDDPRRMSEANPQQAEFSWGDAELVEWTSNDGAPLQGMLFVPDGFDPEERHPMMVYFYERMSDGLHQYRSPAPGGSSISIPFYVSRGYLVFVPDVPYEIGYPGESALDAVVPGVLSLVARGFVDEERIGVQGHSWGGYQIAYMLTKTRLFAAAEAGAPVANMTSAYGGIRWASGMSRMFQYERTQSRIGATLWEATQTYLHNSPLFFADKIGTPLLMMHNDEDGAVPWYQGIEMFVALRRLGKPVWMLNYNGEGHGLSRMPNRKDWAVRMQQFFDHYLMDAPAPVWMAEGVPAVMKGKTLGTEPAGGR